ncbi:MAG: 16S rRNA (cytidine(1402)-2'-O)-methyltransferase [Gammaproteobacteria bacterium]
MGHLYVVATPIGNLQDISQRAIRCLNEVDLIAAEDTRHSAVLLNAYGIKTKTTAFHDHNEQAKVAELIDYLQQGHSIALISDAGTPLVSDPGYHLVSAAHAAGVDVVPVPGACAAIAALSASGLPSDKFRFAGFLPKKTQARKTYLQQYTHATETLIFYESPHRILASMADMQQVFGGDRPASMARELTKKFETIDHGSLDQLVNLLQKNPGQQKGEFVVLIGAAAQLPRGLDQEAEAVLRILLDELSINQAAALAARITGVKKNTLYKAALSLQQQDSD